MIDEQEQKRLDSAMNNIRALTVRAIIDNSDKIVETFRRLCPPPRPDGAHAAERPTQEPAPNGSHE